MKNTATFSSRCKLEAIEAPRDDCCSFSLLFGLLSFAKAFSRNRLILPSLSREISENIISLLLSHGVTEERIKLTKSGGLFTVGIYDREVIERLLLDFGYSGAEPNFRINDSNFLCDRCASSFIAGAFISAGTITNPASSYHLEFSTYKHKLFSDFTELLSKNGFSPKITARSYSMVAYFKESSQIEDILSAIGAIEAAFELMDQKIVRELRNTANRRTNCESANIDKIVASAGNDIALINKLLADKSGKTMPSPLTEIARLRVKHPEMSLSELGELCEVPITKSGVSHRLAKIRELAREL